ncbi:MAG: hypothetical protein AB1405_13930 [Bdellovibrionota bacterium]
MKGPFSFLARALVLAALSLTLASGALAQSKGQDKSWGDGPFHFFFEPRAGVFLPTNDAIHDRYDYDVRNFLMGLRFGYLLETGHLTIWPGTTLPGTLSFSLDSAYVRDEGREIVSPNPDLVLYLVPSAASIEYAFRYKEEPWILPFIGGGFDTVYFREEVKLQPKNVVQGVRFGWHGETGLRFLFDRFDRHAESQMKQHYKFRNMWIALRARYQTVKGFDTGIDLSGFTFDTSFVFEK